MKHFAIVTAGCYVGINFIAPMAMPILSGLGGGSQLAADVAYAASVAAGVVLLGKVL